jgi:predicted ATPase
VGLTEREVGQFITQAVGVEPSPTQMRAITAETNGNPFFVVEVVRLLASEGQLGTTDRRATAR